MSNQNPQLTESIQSVILDRKWWIWDPPPEWLKDRLLRDEEFSKRFLAMEVELKQRELAILQEQVQLEQEKLQQFGKMLNM